MMEHEFVALHGLVEELSLTYQNRCAVIFDDGDTQVFLSYGEMLRLAAQIHKILTQLSIQQEVVGVCLRMGCHVPAILLGILQSGSSFYNFDAGSVEFVMTVLLELNVRVLLLDIHHLQTLESFIFKLRGEIIRNVIPGHPDCVLVHLTAVVPCSNGLRLAYCITTSGTTGTPKVVGVPHSCIVPNIVHIRQIFMLKHDDLVFLSSPLTFDPSIVEMFTTLSVGASLLIVPQELKTMPARLLQVLCTRNKVTIMQATPTLLFSFKSSSLPLTLLSDSSPLRVLSLGGEKFPSCVRLRELRSPNNKTEFFNLYGTTEVSCWATWYKVKDEDFEFDNEIPLGEPLLQTTVMVLDDSRRPVLDGVGEIHIGGTDRQCIVGGESAGYTTALQLRATGDMARASEGCIYYLGRTDRQVKRRGKRINLEEIKQVVDKLPFIQESTTELINNSLVVFITKCTTFTDTNTKTKLADTELKNRLSGVDFMGLDSDVSNRITDSADTHQTGHQTGQVPTNGGVTDISPDAYTKKDNVPVAVLKHIRLELPPHYFPDTVLMIDGFPMTKHGKCDKERLRKFYKASASNSTSAVGFPLNEFVMNSWRNVLEMDSTSQVPDNSMFIASGGNSFKAIQLHNQIETYLNISLPSLLDVILHKPLSELIKLLATTSDSTPTVKESAVEVIDDNVEISVGNNANTSIVHRTTWAVKTCDKYVTHEHNSRVCERISEFNKDNPVENEGDTSGSSNSVGTNVMDEELENMYTTKYDYRIQTNVNSNSYSGSFKSTECVLLSTKSITSTENYNITESLKISESIKSVETIKDAEIIKSTEIIESVKNTESIKCISNHEQKPVLKRKHESVCEHCGSSALQTENRKMILGCNNVTSVSRGNPQIVPGDSNDNKEGAYNHSWPSVEADHLHSPELHCSLELMWRYNTGKCVDASPLIVVSGTDTPTVYVGSHSHRFCSLSLATGECLWETTVADRIESSACLSRCGKYVIVGSYDGNVYVFRSNSGDIWWKFQTGAEVKSSPVVDMATGVVYVGSHSQCIYALNIQMRRVVWERDLESGSIFSSPAVSYDPHQVYVATLGGKLFSISAATGAAVWTYSCGKPLFSSLCVTGHGVCIGCTDNFLYCVSVDGKLLWKYVTGGPIFSSPSVLRLPTTRTHNVSTSGLAMPSEFEIMDGRTVLGVASEQEREAGLESIDGATVTRCDIDREASSNETSARHHHKGYPALECSCSDGYQECLVFGSHENCVYCVTSLGRLRWKVRADSHIYSTPFPLPSDAAYHSKGQDSNIIYQGKCNVDLPIQVCNKQAKYMNMDKINLKQRLPTENTIENVKYDEIGKNDRVPVSVLPNSVIFGSTRGTLYIVNGATGNHLYSRTLPGEVFSSPVVCQDYIVVGCRDDFIYGFKMNKTTK